MMQSSRQEPYSLKARYVFPVAADPIPDGVVTIRGDRILAVGKQPLGDRPEDLGNVAVVPGLVNAHTHLEFSDLAGPLGEPGIDFVEWIRLIIENFRHRDGSSPEALRRGLEESVRVGTTTLGEIAQPGRCLEPFDAVPTDTTVFLELIAPTADRVAPLLELAPRHAGSRSPSGRWRPGLSPHAPYSVLPDLLRRAVALSAESHVPIAFHLAESRAEIDLIRRGTGPFRDGFEELGTCHPDSFVPGGRPLDYLRVLSEAHRALVIHGNYLDDEEIAFLADHARQMAVVYCPRTHAYFRHDPYPLEKMLAAGAVVALGTDSRASSPDLSVLAEMRAVVQKHPSVTHDAVLQLGTIHGAQALGQASEVGSLEPGKFANLAVVALPEQDTADPFELIFNSDRPVVATWYRGSRVTPSPPARTCRTGKPARPRPRPA